mgnify:CR=1 FL=1
MNIEFQFHLVRSEYRPMRYAVSAIINGVESFITRFASLSPALETLRECDPHHPALVMDKESTANG